MYEVSHEHWQTLKLTRGPPGGHIERSLTEKCLAVRWHVIQIVHDHKHLDNGVVRVEQCLKYKSIINSHILLDKLITISSLI